MAEHVQYHDLAGHDSADDQYLETPPGSSYEHTDASAAVLVRFAFWLILSAIIVHVGLGLMYQLMIRQSAEGVETQQYPMAVNQAPRLPAAPRLQRVPSEELYDFRTKEEEELHSCDDVRGQGPGAPALPPGSRTPQPAPPQVAPLRPI